MIRNMNDLPDRLCIHTTSPYYDPDYIRVGIRFEGKEKTNVAEYCISEGWIRVQVGKTKGRDGNLLCIVLKGTVEPYLRS
jgi:hypothetical protein